MTPVGQVLAQPFIRWSYISDHLGLIWSALVQHLELTFIAVGVGFVLSALLAAFAIRFRLSLSGDQRDDRHHVRHPEPGAVHPADADHRADRAHGRDRARELHAADPVPQHRGRHRRRARFRARVGDRDGLHPPPAALASRDPARAAGDRERAADRDGDDGRARADRGHPRLRSGRPRHVHLRRAQSLLQHAAARRRRAHGRARRRARRAARADRARAHTLDPYGRARRERAAPALAWFNDPANWHGGNGVPHRVFEHLWLWAWSMAIAAAIAVPGGLLARPEPALRGRSP